ncbi:unnamed protein product, partial [Chrysoparadoxa australica]
LLSVVDSASKLEGLEFTYWAAAGALIGTHRHHGLIPWDDDADLHLLAGDLEHFLAALPAVDSRVEVAQAVNPRKDDRKLQLWKVYFKDGTPIEGPHGTFPWTAPFLDVFTVDEVDGVFYELRFGPKWTQVWRSFTFMEHSEVFPLVRRPYGQLTINAPQKGIDIMRKRFGPGWKTKCQTKEYSHLNEKHTFQRVFAVPCSWLDDIAPRVVLAGSPVPSVSSETLRLGDDVLHTVVL